MNTPSWLFLLSVICIISAAGGMYFDVYGWGWFLIVGIWLCIAGAENAN